MYHGYTPPFSIASRAIFFLNVYFSLIFPMVIFIFFSSHRKSIKNDAFLANSVFQKIQNFQKTPILTVFERFFWKNFFTIGKIGKKYAFKKKDRPSSYSKKSFSEPIFRGAQSKNVFLHKKMYSTGGTSGHKWIFFV